MKQSKNSLIRDMVLVALTLASLYFMGLDTTAGEFLLHKTIEVVGEDEIIVKYFGQIQ